MATLVSTLLTQIQQATQEDSSFSSGFWTEAEVIGYVNVVQVEFIFLSSILKKIDTVAIQVNQRLFSDPTDSIDIDRISFLGKPFFRGTRQGFDLEDKAWQTKLGRPRKYHRDQLATKKFELDRGILAAYIGGEYTSVGNYGVLTGMSGVLTYVSVLPGGGGSGTITLMQGGIIYGAILPAGGGSGTLGVLQPSAAGPLHLIYTKLPANVALTTDPLTVPDYTVPYLKYGTLTRMWGKQGEGQDARRAEYCKMRYLLGVNLFRRIMGLQELRDIQQGVAA